MMKRLFLLLIVGIGFMLLGFTPKKITTTYVFIDLEKDNQYTLNAEEIRYQCFACDNKKETIYDISEPQFRKVRLQFMITERKKDVHINGRFKDSTFIIIREEDGTERSYTLMKGCEEQKKIQGAFDQVMKQVGKPKVVATE